MMLLNILAQPKLILSLYTFLPTKNTPPSATSEQESHLSENFLLLLSFVSIVHLHVNVLYPSATHVTFCSKSQESYTFPPQNG